MNDLTKNGESMVKMNTDSNNTTQNAKISHHDFYIEVSERLRVETC